MSGANVGTAYMTISPRFDGLSRSVESALNGVDTSAPSGKITKGLSGGILKGGAIAGAAASLVGKAFDAVGSHMSGAIARVDAINNFPRVMQSLGYGAAESEKAINRLSQGIQGLPTSLNGIVSMTQQLAPLTGGLESATTLSLALNDAFNASGASTADVSRAMQQYTQMLSKGSVDLQSWRTLQEVMPGQLNQIAQAMLGASADSNTLYSALQNGTVSMDDFNAAVVRLDKEGVNGMASFHDQAFTATAGIGTAMENVGNRVNMAIGKIIDAIGADNISGAINAFSSQFGNMAQPICNAINFVKDVVNQFGTTLSDKFSALQTAAQPLMNAFQNLFTPIGEFVSGNGTAFSSMMERINGHIQNAAPAFDALATAISALGQVLEPITSVLGPLIVEMIANIVSAVIGLIPTITSVVSFVVSVVTLIIGTVSTLVSTIVGAVTSFVSFVGGVISSIVSAISSAISNIIAFFNGLISFISGVPGAIIGFFAGIGDGIVGFFSGIPASVEGIFNSIVDFVTGIPDRIIGFFSGLGDRITSAIGSIHFPQPSISWEDVQVGPTSIPIPRISWYAQGGIFKQATLLGGMNGVGEAGAEAVVPLTNKRYSKPFAKTIADQMGSGGKSSNVYNIYLDGKLLEADQAVKDAVAALVGSAKRQTRMGWA